MCLKCIPFITNMQNPMYQQLKSYFPEPQNKQKNKLTEKIKNIMICFPFKTRCFQAEQGTDYEHPMSGFRLSEELSSDDVAATTAASSYMSSDGHVKVSF